MCVWEHWVMSLKLLSLCWALTAKAKLSCPLPVYVSSPSREERDWPVPCDSTSPPHSLAQLLLDLKAGTEIPHLYPTSILPWTGPHRSSLQRSLGVSRGGNCIDMPFGFTAMDSHGISVSWCHWVGCQHGGWTCDFGIQTHKLLVPDQWGVVQINTLHIVRCSENWLPSPC